MSENNLLFVENKLNRWKRPESPKPGTAFVFVGDGKPSRVVHEGERSLTQGEVFWGGYKTYYEVDLGDRSINFQETLPCADALEFQAEIKLTYVVSDPALIVRRRIKNDNQVLKDLAIDIMRRTSRNYSHKESREAENMITRRIEEEVRDKGFKLNRCLIKLSLDEEISGILRNREVGNYQFEDTLSDIKKQAEIQKERAKIYASLMKDGDWKGLLAMIDPNNPAEEKLIREMVNIILNEQKMNYEDQQKMFATLIDLGVIEKYELEELAKQLIKKVGRLSEQSVDLLEAEIEDSQHIEDSDISIPDEISRDSNE